MIRSSANHPRNTCLTGLVELNLNIMSAHSFILVVDCEVHSPIFTIHLDPIGKLRESLSVAVGEPGQGVGIHLPVPVDRAEFSNSS